MTIPHPPSLPVFRVAALALAASALAASAFAATANTATTAAKAVPAGTRAPQAARTAPAADTAAWLRAAAASAQAQRGTAARLPGLLRNYLLAVRQVPGDDAATEPETERADPDGLAIALPKVLQTVGSVMDGAPSKLFVELEAAQRGFAAALDALNKGGTDASPQFMVGVLQSMAEGQSAMGQALDVAAVVDPGAVALLLPAVQSAREAARRTSSSLVELALRAGVSDGRIAPAQEALRTADALYAAGDYGGAGQQYAGAFGLAANTVVFSMDRLEDNLRSVFDGNTVGWAYALSQGGALARSGSAGLARTGADLPQTAQSPTKKMHVASVSKTMTSIVLLHRLAEMGVSVDSPIGAWLPLTWVRGAGVDTMTFRQLMTHRSGFGQNAVGGNDYAKLQTMVAQDVPSKGSFKYFNANFGLLRVITAKLLGFEPSLYPLDPGALTTAVFLSYAATVYAPSGVPFSCEPQGTNPTRQYDFPDSGNPGYAEPSQSLSCGGYGVQVSATDLARTLSYLRYTQDLMPTTSFQTMKSGFLGFMNPADNYGFAQGVFGTYHTHGGDWDHTGWGGLDTCVMVYPINVEAAVAINSSRKQLGVGYPNGGYQCGVLKWAFENAWVAQ